MFTKGAFNYSKNSNIVKYFIQKITVFYYNIIKNVMYASDGKAEFSAAINPVPHDPSEIILIWCWRIILLCFP